ncbi:MAG: dihydrolipoyl dehydrogenase, partial [Deltaproteobacteria bacterium]
RRPNLEGLGLEHAGLERDEAGIPRFDPFTMQCGDSPIFIAGDVNNDRPILHEAADEGRIAGRNAARYPDIEAGRRRSALSIVFCDPQLAIVGTPFGELPTGHFVTGEVSFENQGRSRIMRKNRGRLHLYAEYGSGLFLGAEIVGPHAEHLGHLLAWAHQEKMTVAQMIGMPFYHPVVEEGVRTALGDAIRKLHLGKPSEKPCLDCGPGT